MDLSNILVISGKPDLSELVSQTKGGAVVMNLVTGQKYPVFKNDRISSLGEIRIFTETDERPLEGYDRIHLLNDYTFPKDKDTFFKYMPLERFVGSVDKGEFVFTFTPSTMTVGKKYVKTGVSSDLLIEITEGLDEKDLIVTDYKGVVEEGKMATPAAESQSLITEELSKK